MLEQPLDHRRGRSHHVGTDLGGFEHMDAVAHARDEDLGFIAVIVVDQPDVGDEPHAVEAIVVVRSEEHTSELQSLMRISYAVFCLKKKTTTSIQHPRSQEITKNRKNK